MRACGSLCGRGGSGVGVLCASTCADARARPRHRSRVLGATRSLPTHGIANMIHQRTASGQAILVAILVHAPPNARARAAHRQHSTRRCFGRVRGVRGRCGRRLTPTRRSERAVGRRRARAQAQWVRRLPLPCNPSQHGAGRRHRQRRQGRAARRGRGHPLRTGGNTRRGTVCMQPCLAAACPAVPACYRATPAQRLGGAPHTRTSLCATCRTSRTTGVAGVMWSGLWCVCPSPHTTHAHARARAHTHTRARARTARRLATRAGAAVQGAEAAQGHGGPGYLRTAAGPAVTPA